MNVALIISCGEKKVVIVEQIKAYKDSLLVIEKKHSKLLDEITDAQGKFIGQQALDTVAAIEIRQSQARSEIFTARAILKAKIDSLELELRKY